MTTLSHELRLPLTAIMGYASALLLDEISWPREKQVEIIGRIVEESESMQAMLKNLLNASLIEAERISIQPQQLRLRSTAREIVEEFQNRTKKHRIFVELPSGFPTIRADPKWIKQVLRNLLDNAIKYSPAGGLIVMRGEIRRKDIVLSIADQGIGIPPEDIPTLFEKYYRVKPPSGIRVPGTGLGLPIARTIVEAHGGRIWVESILGQGTTVSFSLPHSPSNEFYEG
jgi:two-component system sensor histidine kinase VicK